MPLLAPSLHLFRPEKGPLFGPDAKSLKGFSFLNWLKGNAMQNVTSLVPNFPSSPAKKAIVALMTMSLSACGGASNLWQGQEVLVEARQTVLERDVYNVSDDHRELKDRFNALERLYVELVQQHRAQTAKLAVMEATVSKVKEDPEAAAKMTRVRSDVSVIREQMKKLEGRIFSVEMSEQQVAASEQPKPAATMADAAPAAASTPVGAMPASVQPGTTATVPVNNNAQPAQTFYGVHLASYRSQEQVASGWAGLMQGLGGDLEGLTPLIYTQSQEGIGTFLRLIAGPLINKQEANALCTRIRQSASEQYCRVSEYQGEPVG